MTKEDYVEMNGVFFHQENLPTGIRGYTYHDDEGCSFVVLNSRMPWEINQHSADHEFRHILRGDSYNPSYDEYE